MTNPTDRPAAGASAPSIDEARSLPALFEAGRSQIEALLPKGKSLEFLIASVRLEAEKTPLLRQCTGRSIISSSARILRRGLELGTEAYLVPFRSTKLSEEASKQAGRSVDVYECVDVTGYTGYASLMMRTGIVRGVEVEVVYQAERDTLDRGGLPYFDYAYGSEKFLRHRPIEDPRKRGRIIGAYCIVRLPHQNWDFKFVTYEEADDIRKRHSKMFKGLNETPAWYVKKRAVIVMAKLMPKSAMWAEVIEMVQQDEAEEGVEAHKPLQHSVNDERPQAPAADPVDVSGMAEEPAPRQLPSAVPQATAPKREMTAAEREESRLLDLDEQRFAQ